MSIFTAVITPFDKDTNVDYKSFEKIINNQIEHNINGIVLFGTTGEAPTLKMSEKFKLLHMTKNLIDNSKKDIKLILGFGGNNTYQVIEEMVNFSSIDNVIFMLSSPYYNKPTQEGLYQHYTTIMSKFSDKQFLIYNIPGRTSVNLLPETIKRISKTTPNIYGIKEASGSLDQVSQLINFGFDVYSGDDSMAYDVVKMGGKGVVSVLSNQFIKEMEEVLSLNETMNKEMEMLYKLAFIETNPSPIKYIMCLFKTIDCDQVRLPLVTLMEENKTLINNYFLGEKMEIIE